MEFAVAIVILAVIGYVWYKIYKKNEKKINDLLNKDDE